MSNIITAIINLVSNLQLELVDYNNTKNRANSKGSILEEYVKDLFAGTLKESNKEKRSKKFDKIFSYIGNDSNPPDAMLNKGDAIEIKKIESNKSDIQLNSSHPKYKLCKADSMLTKDCKQAENGNWEKKDLLYIVGCVKRKILHSMFWVYGVDFAASKEKYSQIKNNIKDILKKSEKQFVKTKELGRLNNIDPLRITSLRIRGMWTLQNPWKIFSDIIQLDNKKSFNFCAIINTQKYKSFPEHTKLERLAKKGKGLEIRDVKIKNPNKPEKFKKAKLIRYTR